MSFKSDFLWGGAISACQAEGAWNLDGKSLTFPEIVKKIDPSKRKLIKQATITQKEIDEGKIGPIEDYPKRWGIDFYHTYKDDIKLFHEMGFNVFRFSIAISRVFPNLDEESPNEEALKFYDSVIDECLKYHIEPLVTISHFDPPICMWEKYRGWSNEEMIDIYLKFTDCLFRRYRNKVKYWITFNEINMALKAPFKTLGMISGEGVEYENRRWKGIHNQFLASAKSVIRAKGINPNFKIGAMIGCITTYPYSSDPRDNLANLKYDQMMNLSFLDVMVKGKYPYYLKHYFEENDIHLNITKEDEEILLKGAVDYVGFSYYMSVVTSYTIDGKQLTSGNMVSGLKNEYLDSTEWGWQIDPVGLRITVNQLYDRYNKPLFVLENGIGKLEVLNDDNTVEDDYRSEYLVQHLKQLKLAIKDGCEVMGYTWWAPIDIVSSSTSEMSKRYGFIYVDQDDCGLGTKKRYKKTSFETYKRIIETNGEIL